VWYSSKERIVVTSFYVYGRRAPIHKPGFFHIWNFFIHNVGDVDYTSVT
jgi:hypothetical protein